ncbi:CRISPR-associated endoribonuclease Cas6 [uncultured Ruminococcus sp.]
MGHGKPLGLGSRNSQGFGMFEIKSEY